jgi:hypothetical protein
MNFVAAILLMGRLPDPLYNHPSLPNSPVAAKQQIRLDNEPAPGGGATASTNEEEYESNSDSDILVGGPSDSDIIAVEADVYAFLVELLGEPHPQHHQHKATEQSQESFSSSPKRTSVFSAVSSSFGAGVFDDAQERSLCMGGLWKEKMPSMKLRVYQLDRYQY